MNKRAESSYPLHDLIADRWSPRAYADRPVEAEKLGSLFEAARWAPSCFNAQPWSFLAATSSNTSEFDKLAACLMDGNAWAKKAPVLVLSIAHTTFERNGKPNRHAGHDVGLAVQNLVTQAQAMGLVCHQMAGFHVDVARETLGLPENTEPMAMIAIGYEGEAASLGEELAAREAAPRERKPLESVVHGASWGTKLELT